MQYKSLFFERASEYLEGLRPKESAKAKANIEAMCAGHLGAVHTKKLEGPIRELIVGRHRLPYFLIADTIYFVSGFLKKTKKTPKSEIDYAKKKYKIMKD